MNGYLKAVLLTLLVYSTGFPKQSDTLFVTSNQLRIANVKEGKSRYLVYFSKGKEAPISDIQIWNIEIKKEWFNGTKAITIYQKWDFKDTIYHTAKSVNAIENFKPLYHESWWAKRDKKAFDVAKNKVWIDDVEVKNSDTNNTKKAVFESFSSCNNQYFVNWHLDLEVFAMLPYRKNRVFMIPFYEFGYGTPKDIAYEVTGETKMTYAGKKVKCWLLSHIEDGNEETFWISKKTNEVLKLEQVVKGTMFRYKYKLPED